MRATRRDFIRLVAGGSGAAALGLDISPLVAQAHTLKTSKTTETRSSCPYCAVCCGVIVHTIGDGAKNVVPAVVHIEGDPDHPVNRGTLCPKGASLQQDCINERRLTKPQVRRPGSSKWDDISWDKVLDEIARKVKDTRDKGFVHADEQGRTVNRCENIMFAGGATDTNEFCWTVVKTMAALGVVRHENVART
jgi:formate dehydrogenase major subunit